MKTEFLSDGWRDFHQRYKDTFGWFEREGKPSVLVKLVSIEAHGLEFVDEQGFRYNAYPDKGNFFTFLPVVKGCYLFGDKVVTVERIPARQWRRGICNDNTSITNTAGYFYSVDFPIIKAIFTGQNNTIERYKLAKQLPVLLNSQFHIEHEGVFVYNKRIGNFGDDTIILDDSVFSQELGDLMKQHQLPIRVVHEAT